MIEVIGVRFKSVGKVYYFDPKGINFELDDFAIVETARGVECGEVVMENRSIEDDKVVSPLKPVIRKATQNDLDIVEKNRKKEVQAMDICEEKIAKHKLEMKLIDVEYTFDNSKILFYFTAESRVDFRELVKDLASVFRTRIELRQIGVRDEAKMLGGIGICGRAFCCATFLGEFQPVSIKMAKEQSLSLNPTKISGTCGRLMCCLKYEQESYEELLKITPKVGAYVDTPEGRGNVEEVNLLTGKLSVRLVKAKESAPITVSRKDVKVIRDGRIKLDKEEIKALKELEDK
ncbi:MAG: stage 0 sporulation family protein [Clostridiales bacterium]|nr:stage 0 sporulation family protein [Clostridiales bacterium]